MRSSFALVFAFIALSGLAPRTVAQLTPEWTERFDHQFQDAAFALAVDESDAIYVTGSTSPTQTGGDVLTIKYDSNGNQQWIATFDGPSSSLDLGRDILVDPQGDILVLAQSECDLWVLRYDAMTGSLLDSIRHDGGFCPENPNAFTCDSQGNIYIAAQSWGNQNDFYTVKLDSTGNMQWFAQYDGPGPFLLAHDVPVDIALDSHGDVFVTGPSNATSGSEDYVTIKYSGVDGTQLWLDRYTGAGANDVAVDLTIDANDNVYVTGSSFQSGWRYATIKYANSDGQRIWVALDNPGFDDFANALSVDSQGNVYVIGCSDPDGDDSNLNDNAVIAKHRATDGAQVWMTIYGENAFNQFDDAIDIAIDPFDHVFVTGQVGSFGASFDLMLLELESADGSVLSEHVFDSGPSELTAGIELALDSTHGLVVTGTARNGNTEARDIVTLKFPGTCDLEFGVQPQQVSESDLLVFQASGGAPNGLLLLAATAVDETPLFLRVLIDTFDANGSWQFAPATPPGLAGLAVTFHGFGVDCQGAIGQSQPMVVNFE